MVSEVILCISDISDFHWSKSQKDQNLGPEGGYLVYAGYFWLLIVQGQSNVIQCISDFWQEYTVTSAT